MLAASNGANSASDVAAITAPAASIGPAAAPVTAPPAVAAPAHGGDLTGTANRPRTTSLWPDENAVATCDVLLVEDEEKICRLYRLLLRGRGYTVRTAADGIIALEQVADQRPDLILLDMMMPRMDGLTFLQHLRRAESGRDIPVIVLSNFKEPDLLRAALELGALEYLVKSNTRPDALLGAMPYWVRGERAFTA